MSDRYVSPDCRANASGFCDGFDKDGRWCDCPCHTEIIFESTQAAKAWHKAALN